LALFCVRLIAQQPPYKNLDALKGVPPERIPAVMQAFNGFLGVPCTHCHVEGKRESEEKPAFGRARQMFRMRAALNSGPLKEYAGIGCWTCHRGRARPAELPMEPVQKLPWPAELVLKPEQRSQPAKAVFKNIEIFRGLPATTIRSAMSVFSVSLGVTCDHCHVAGDYSAETKAAKATARKMMAVVRESGKEFASSALSCWTCHQGAAKPLRNAPGAP
jgi:hypothetical protein